MAQNSEKTEYYLPWSGEQWFYEHHHCVIQPSVYEKELEEPAIVYDHEGNALAKPKERIGFKLWED